MNRCLRQRRIVGASVATIANRDMKYDAVPTSTAASTSACAARSSAVGTSWRSWKPNRAVTVVMPSAVAKVVDRHPLGWGDVRDARRLDEHDQHAAVDDVVVLEVGPQGERGGVAAAVQEHAGLRRTDAGRPDRADLFDEARERPLCSVSTRSSTARPRLNVVRTVKTPSATPSGRAPR
jgi:hypothetical protein